ncbi:MAG: gamma-glutamyl-phosphate reductase, partial [Gammaproteobacteria bacterium]|nr:gamma-glutamyl-phosphate reductase [Gammaproteobacteria bacterium]
MTMAERHLAKTSSGDRLHGQMHLLGRRARQAAELLGRASTDSKNVALRAAAQALLTSADDILSAN